MTLWKWSRTAATNGTSDSTCPFPEGMAPSAVNDGVRGAMAAVAKYRDDVAGIITTSGSATAYTVSSFQVFDTLAHLDGAKIAFVPHATNTGACTLNVDSLGAKALRATTGAALNAGTLIAGTPYIAVYINANSEWLLINGMSSVPPGVINPYGGASAPVGWLLCDGSEVSQTTYAALYAVLGNAYGAVAGNFNVPDLRGRVPFGIDNMGGSDAARLANSANSIATFRNSRGGVGGTDAVTLNTTMIPSHTHTATVTDPGHTHEYLKGSGGGYQGGGVAGDLSATTSTSTSSGATGISVSNSSTGGGGAHDNIPPGLIVSYIIKT